MATTPNVIGIRGRASEIRREKTPQGREFLEILVTVETPTRDGTVWYDYFPVSFWGDKIPDWTPRDGETVDVEAVLRGRQGKSGRCFVSLNGVKLTRVVPDGGEDWRPMNEVPEVPAKGDGAMPF
jgi:hypothetical protein